MQPVKTKDLYYNTSYNINNNQIGIDEVCKKLNKKCTEIMFCPHLFDRMESRNFDLDKVEETIRTGEIVYIKCILPDKICFRRYYGKENMTYTVIALFHCDFIEVKTAWAQKGR
jgi:hypothetical protein